MFRENDRMPIMEKQQISPELKEQKWRVAAFCREHNAIISFNPQGQPFCTGGREYITSSEQIYDVPIKPVSTRENLDDIVKEM